MNLTYKVFQVLFATFLELSLIFTCYLFLVGMTVHFLSEHIESIFYL